VTGPRGAFGVQELFGTATHPLVAGGREPVTLELLSPVGRPIQVTADLAGFWTGSWRELREERAGRYPKQRWPDGPSAVSPPFGPGWLPPPRRGRSSAKEKPLSWAFDSVLIAM
jgi:HrpA-like RNA helicase